MKREKPPKSLIIPPSTKLDTNIPLRFSFKHLDLYSNAKFNVDLCERGYLEKFLVRLKDLCGLSVQEFRTNKSSSLKAHRINWPDTKEVAGFSRLNEQLRDEEAWQFEITKNEHGRVHGILLEDTFYVIWVDPTHYLYS